MVARSVTDMDIGRGDQGGPSPDPARAAAARLDAQITVLQSASTASWTPQEHCAALDDLVRARNRLEAAYLHIVERFAVRPDAAEAVGGGTSAGAAARVALVQACGVDPGQARRDVDVARLLAADGSGIVADDDPSGSRFAPTSEGLPRVGSALAAGHLSRAHADAAATCLTRIPRRLLSDVADDGWSGAARVDAFLAEHAPQLTARQTARLGRQLLDVLDPSGQDRYDPEAYRRRDLSYRRDPTGMLVGRFALDPAAGSAFTAALDAIMRQDQGGEQATDDRTPGQRRADALVEMAARSGAGSDGPAGEGREEAYGSPGAQVHVVATWEQLMAALQAQPRACGGDGEPIEPLRPQGVGGPGAPGLASDLSDGYPLAPGTLGRLMCGAALSVTALDAAGAVLAQGRSTRLANRAQRRALVARDRGCVVPGCSAAPRRCDAHHVVWWRHGGRTDIDNLVLLCQRHHTEVHAGLWRLQMVDGTCWAVPPPTLDPERTPRRNIYWEAVDGSRRLGQHLRGRRWGDGGGP